MREIDKTYSIKKNRQMKTTTILMTLLIAVALISSSAVTATTTNMNEKENIVENIVTIPTESITAQEAETLTIAATDAIQNPGTEPLEAPGDVLWFFDAETPSGDNQMLGVEIIGDEIWATGGGAGADPNKLYKFSLSGSLLNTYDQPPHSTSWGWRDLAYNTLDGFLYGSVNSNIDQIDPATGLWTGVSYPGPISPCRALAHDPATDHFWTASFSSAFYEFDSAGTIYNSFPNPWGGAYGMAWDDACGLPSLWVHDQYGSGTDLHEVDPTTGMHTGLTYQYTQGIAGGLAFVDMGGYGQLIGLTQGTPDEIFSIEICETIPIDHDVAVLDIIAPNDQSAFCPCTPVEVTVTNWGIFDEVDVPVSVEIRRYVFTDDFSAPWMNWYEIPWGNHWDYVPLETAYPGYVTPQSAPFMVELDSGLTGPGGSDFVSTPFDLTGFCAPFMSFYMWHDEYGSDDFIDVYVNGVKVGGPYYRLCCPDCPVGWQEHKIDLTAFTGQVITIVFEGNCDQNPGAYNLQIDDFSLYDQEYYQTKNVDIEVGEELDVEFPEWCPCHWQDPAWANTYFTVEIVACTGLAVDQRTSNDCKRETANLYMPFEHDIASISIDEPVGRVPVQTFEMCGTIKNVGQYQECCFSVYMTVEEVVYGPFFTVYQEDFSSVIPPALPTGWVEETPTGNWRTASYSYAGVAPELQFYWIPYVYGTYRCITPPINTVGMSEVLVEFDHYLSHYSGPYILRVETSTTGLPGSFTPIPVQPHSIYHLHLLMAIHIT